MTPTARTIALMRERGFTADVVERRITKRLTRDFLGIIDVIALKEGCAPWFIQTTGGNNKWMRRQKMLESPHLPLLQSVGTVVLHEWNQLKNGEWSPREEVLL